ncbi:MAG TPA: hypothetical protein VFF52_24065 [Isosphaeraceae bacterium]|nr:hypothetical protein [Isosphaeraceae bacterium]
MEKDRHRAFIAGAIATTDTSRAIALADTVGGLAFYHELVKTEIAYKIGADRLDEAIKIIESIKRDRWDAQWQAGAFGWLAVAVAPRDRKRACALIDRALALMIDLRDWMGRGDEMTVAARIAVCARRIGYPDMESVVMRVMAARPTDSPGLSGDRARLMQSVTEAAVPLALIDPGTARTVLEQISARSGLDPTTLWNVRQPWLTAWALVDLKRAEALFEAELTALEGAKEVDLWNAGFFPMLDFLAAPPHRREAALGDRSSGGFWWPGQDL